MESELLEKLWRVAKAFLERKGTHDIGHVKRVYKLASMICKKESCDINAVQIAAILHDIGRPIEDITGEDHATISANIATRLLQLWKVENETIEKVYDAIINHRFSKGRVPTTWEGKVLSDADKLDALGAVGVARVFKHDCSRPIEKDIEHFYEKILKLPDLMYTDTGRKLAQERKKFVEYFLETLKKEIDNDK